MIEADSTQLPSTNEGSNFLANNHIEPKLRTIISRVQVHTSKLKEMRALKCKVLMLSTKIDPKEPGKYVYRQNRWAKFDAEEINLLNKLQKQQIEKIQAKKRDFYVRSQPKLNIPDESTTRCAQFSKNDKLAPYLNVTNKDYLKKEAKIKELCYVLGKKEIDMISDDPLFYFKNQGYLVDQEMIVQKEWDLESGLSKPLKTQNIYDTEQKKNLFRQLSQNKSLDTDNILSKIIKANKSVEMKNERFTRQSKQIHKKLERRMQEQKNRKEDVEKDPSIANYLKKRKIETQSQKKPVAINKAVFYDQQSRKEQFEALNRKYKAALDDNRKKIELEKEMNVMNHKIKLQAIRSMKHFPASQSRFQMGNSQILKSASPSSTQNKFSAN